MPDRFDSGLHPRGSDGQFIATAVRVREFNTATVNRLRRDGWQPDETTGGWVRSVRFRSSPIITAIPDRIQAWSGGRIRQDTFDFFKDPANSGVIIAAESALSDGTTVAVGGVGIVGGETVHSFTVTDPNHRIEGHGRATLLERVRHCDWLGLNYETTVAEDNQASRRMLESVGFLETDRERRTRSDGPYTAVTYTTGAF